MKTSNSPITVRLPHHRKSTCSIFGSLTALAAGLALLGGQSIVNAQSDNFNDGDDFAPVVAAWTHLDPIYTASGGASLPNTYDASTFQYHLIADASTATNGLGQARTLSMPPNDYTNFYASVDLVDWSISTAQAFGLVARISEAGPGTTDGYAFGLLSGGVIAPGQSYVRILRLQNESTKDVHGSGPAGDSKMPIPDLDPAKDYRLVFMGNGTDLEGRLYELPNLTTPIAVAKGSTAGDAIILTNGQCGLLAFGAATVFGADVTFDNYYASARCPMTITDMVVKDNFNDGNDTSPTVAWQHYDPIASVMGPQNTWSFPGGNTYRLQAPIPPIPDAGQGRVGSFDPTIRTDFRIAADLVSWLDDRQDIGIGARLGNIGLGQTTGYVMTFDYSTGGAGDIDISRLDNEGTTSVPLSGEDSFEMLPGKSYRYVFSGKGSELRALVFELPETMNPVIDCIGTDATHASGKSGLIAAAQNATTYVADVTYDNFSDTPLVAPTISLTLGSGPGGEFTVTWPANIECVWVLESSPELGTAAVWTEVPTTTTAGDAAKMLYDPLTGKNTYTSSAAMIDTGNTYYRLKQL